MGRQKAIKGQSLVEFALILPILLLFMFVIIESGRVLWAWTTLQNAAREGARYAVTGRKMSSDDCPVAHLPKFNSRPENNACVGVEDFRPASVISVTHNALAGLKLDEASFVESPYAYDILVRGYDKNGEPRGSYLGPVDEQQPYAGDPNQTVTVHIFYQVPIITPFLNGIVESIPVQGVVTLNNEAFGQLGNANQGIGIPPPPPPVFDFEPPLVMDDQYSTGFDEPLTVPAVGVLLNDELRGGVFKTWDVGTPNGGTVQWELDGEGLPTGGFTYIPAAGYQGPDTFTYQLGNLGGDSAVATVTIFVDPPFPQPGPDTYTIFANELLVVPSTDNPSILANDVLHGAALSVPEVPPGVVTALGVTITDLAADGSFTYSAPTQDTPTEYQDSFTYTVENAAGPTNATVTIIVKPPPPIANNDVYSAFINQDLSIAASGVLQNDRIFSAPGQIVSFDATTTQGGTVVALNSDGSFIYRPKLDYVSENNIADTFRYTLRDALGEESTATVSIFVQPLVPEAKDDANYQTDMNVDLVVTEDNDVFTNDTLNGATIIAYDATTLEGGSVVMDTARGTFTYSPPTDFVSLPVDTFTYTLENNEGRSTAVVSIFVNPPFPRALDDFYTTPVNTLLRVEAGGGLLANDVVNGGIVTGFDSRSAEGGSVTVNPNGSFDYQPPTDFMSNPSNDTFQYVVSNSSGSSEATVSIFVGEADPDNVLSGIARVALPIPAPQEGVQVALFDEVGNLLATATTDLIGFYHFDNLTPGTYTVTACYDVGNVQHSAILAGVPAPNAFADLFLMPGVCTAP